MAKDIKKEVKKTYSLREKGRRGKTSSIGGTYKDRESTQRYQKAKKSFERKYKDDRTTKVKPMVAETFDYVANLNKVNIYLYDYTNDLMKIYIKHSDKMEKFFLTAIKKLQTENSGEEIIKKYKEAENKVLRTFKKAYEQENMSDAEFLSFIQDTTNVTKNELVNQVAKIKEVFDAELGKQLFTEEQVEAKVKEIISKEKAPAKSKAKPAEYNAKNLILFLVCCFGGWFGIHRFIQGKIITGLIFALSGGVFGVGVFLDCLVLGIDAIKDAKKYMKEKEKTNG